ncbi:ketopantoate reductase family protein [Cereibacter sphaeroides]|nr:ketopantoate reductase family protein [Cereibacter sphaeroides]
MRVIIFGVGAIGGVVAAALARSGAEVIGIARGKMLEAIRANGVRLRSPEVDVTVPVEVVASPAEITFRPDDAILLCMKTQDTMPALEALRQAGVHEQPIFCLQNGVSNEPMALRFFPNVHGVTVMMPATFLVPGEVNTHAYPRFGLFDIGRYPAGTDAADEALAALMDAANIAAYVDPKVMASKHGKLLLNLGNITGAAFGPDTDDKALRQAMMAEAKAVFAAAGIDWKDVSGADPRRQELLKIGEIKGGPDMSNSTLQSLLRGNGVETDYLNGEIAFQGRKAGVPTPLADAMIAIAVRMQREGITPGSLSLPDTMASLGLS